MKFDLIFVIVLFDLIALIIAQQGGLISHCCQNDLCPADCVRCDGTPTCYDLSDELGCSNAGDTRLLSYQKPPVFVPFILNILKSRLRQEKIDLYNINPNHACFTAHQQITTTEIPAWETLLRQLHGSIDPKPATTTTEAPTTLPVWKVLLHKLQGKPIPPQMSGEPSVDTTTVALTTSSTTSTEPETTTVSSDSYSTTTETPTTSRDLDISSTVATSTVIQPVTTTVASQTTEQDQTTTIEAVSTDIPSLNVTINEPSNTTDANPTTTVSPIPSEEFTTESASESTDTSSIISVTTADSTTIIEVTTDGTTPDSLTTTKTVAMGIPVSIQTGGAFVPRVETSSDQENTTTDFDKPGSNGTEDVKRAGIFIPMNHSMIDSMLTELNSSISILLELEASSNDSSKAKIDSSSNGTFVSETVRVARTNITESGESINTTISVDTSTVVLGQDQGSSPVSSGVDENIDFLTSDNKTGITDIKESGISVQNDTSSNATDEAQEINATRDSYEINNSVLISEELKLNTSIASGIENASIPEYVVNKTNVNSNANHIDNENVYKTNDSVSTMDVSFASNVTGENIGTTLKNQVSVEHTYSSPDNEIRIILSKLHAMLDNDQSNYSSAPIMKEFNIKSESEVTVKTQTQTTPSVIPKVDSGTDKHSTTVAPTAWTQTTASQFTLDNLFGFMFTTPSEPNANTQPQNQLSWETLFGSIGGVPVLKPNRTAPLDPDQTIDILNNIYIPYKNQNQIPSSPKDTLDNTGSPKGSNNGSITYETPLSPSSSNMESNSTISSSNTNPIQQTLFNPATTPSPTTQLPSYQNTNMNININSWNQLDNDQTKHTTKSPVTSVGNTNVVQSNGNGMLPTDSIASWWQQVFTTLPPDPFTMPTTTYSPFAEVEQCFEIQDITGFCQSRSGHFSNPTDCRTFYVCMWGYLHRCSCPPNTMFDSKIHVCNWESLVTCAK